MQKLLQNRSKLIQLAHELQKLLLRNNTEFEQEQLFRVYKKEFAWLHRILFDPQEGTAIIGGGSNSSNTLIHIHPKQGG